MKNKGLLVVFLSILLVAVPIASAVSLDAQYITRDGSDEQDVVEETTTILSVVNGKRIEKEMTVSSIESLIELGESFTDDFLTIYDKTKSTQEVDQAMQNIRPFFEALVDNDLTDSSVDELVELYYTIRDRIREPRRGSSRPAQDGGLQPKALWNGIPTPVYGNFLFGIMDVGLVYGFALGSHTVLPTIGIDAFLVYAFTGTSTTVGFAGWTLAVAAMQVILGFIGVLLTTPLMMVGPYLMTGLGGGMLGIGL